MDTAKRELAMTLMEVLFLLSPHCNWERWPHPSLQVSESWPQWLKRDGATPHLRRWSQWLEPDKSATTQSHSKGFELAHPNIYAIYDLVGVCKGNGPAKP